MPKTATITNLSTVAVIAKFEQAAKKYEKALLQSPIVPWSYFASNFYHNVYWYPVVGRKRVKEALHSKWGQLFQSYGDGKVVLPGPEPVSASIAAGAGVAAVTGAVLAAKSLLKE